MQESWSNVTLGLEDVFSGVLMAREEPNLGEDGRPLQFVEAAYKWLDPSKLLETGGDECFRIKQVQELSPIYGNFPRKTLFSSTTPFRGAASASNRCALGARG